MIFVYVLTALVAAGFISSFFENKHAKLFTRNALWGSLALSVFTMYMIIYDLQLAYSILMSGAI
jgi:hypothetical protein